MSKNQIRTACPPRGIAAGQHEAERMISDLIRYGHKADIVHADDSGHTAELPQEATAAMIEASLFDDFELLAAYSVRRSCRTDFTFPPDVSIDQPGFPSRSFQ